MKTIDDIWTLIRATKNHGSPPRGGGDWGGRQHELTTSRLLQIPPSPTQDLGNLTQTMRKIKTEGTDREH